MSKPLSSDARLNLTTAPGALVKNTVRMGLYWLCTTVLLWPRLHPLAEWQPLTVLCFFFASSLIVPALGYLSVLLRGSGGNTGYSLSHGSPASFAHTLSHTGTIAMEVLVVLLTAVAVERLLF